MLRLVFYLILAYLAMRFIRWLVTPSRARSRQSEKGRRGATMVRCATCGMFVTERSALVAEGHDFCSRQCLERRARRA
ncbi:MAG TPA: PP0621 family protein [Blastocatellia bacterium]|nr:PP0621 family protein [Blastocatellia bacterium]